MFVSAGDMFSDTRRLRSLNYAPFHCLDNSFRPAVDFQLPEHAGDMVFNRFFTDKELVGNLPVSQAVGHEGKDFFFPGGQRILLFRAELHGQLPVIGHEHPRDPWMDIRAPCTHCFNGFNKGVGIYVFQKIAVYSRFDAFQDMSLIVIYSQGNYFYRRITFYYLPA